MCLSCLFYITPGVVANGIFGKRVSAVFHQNLNMSTFLLSFVILLIVVLCATLSLWMMQLAFNIYIYIYFFFFFFLKPVKHLQLVVSNLPEPSMCEKHGANTPFGCFLHTVPIILFGDTVCVFCAWKIQNMPVYVISKTARFISLKSGNAVYNVMALCKEPVSVIVLPLIHNIE